RALQIEQEHARIELVAQEAARQRAAITEQTVQVVARRIEEEQMLLAQQQVRLETEQRVLAEIEQRVSAEVLATAAAEEREIAEQHARETAQQQEMAAREATRAAEKLTELKQRESERLLEQAEQTRAESATYELMARLRNSGRIGKFAKAVGLVSVMAFVGLSLPLLFGQDSTVNAQPVTTANESAHAAPAETKAVEAKHDLAAETYVVLGDLKMSGQLSKKN
ncbi:MAG TPA: hypothetical protein VFP33_13420, partial [Gallionella sp.]|nr:hypothetical protein [Gallionella sp.]